MKKILAAMFAVALAGCNATTIDMRRGLAPQSENLVKATESAGAVSTSPVLLRIFKESNELELWRQSTSGKFVLVRTYAICTYSGQLGPKNRQGDRQAPEGFYSIKPGQLNYQSIRFLSLNTGFPNAYDKANGASGSALMIHGGCDSAGCYAIEDAPVQEVFTAVRDAFKAGQKEVQLQIYPFRMDPLNMFFHQSDKHMPFWNQLKTGYDLFESTHRVLLVTVVDKRYLIR